jgi:putative transposase
MPEHVHMLVSEPEHQTLAFVMQIVKQQVARAMKRNADDRHFWQKRYFDFNVRTEKKRIEKLRYIHRNPVARGLCREPEEWPWSSFRHYLTGEVSLVEIESQ